MKRKQTILLAMASLVFLASCADKRVMTAIKPPPERLICANEPNLPTAPITDAKTADYMVAQRGAWQSCHSALAWVRGWFADLPD